MIPINSPLGWSFTEYDPDMAVLGIDRLSFNATSETDEYLIFIQNLQKWLEDNDLLGYRTRFHSSEFNIMAANGRNHSVIKSVAKNVTVVTREKNDELGGERFFSRPPMTFETFTCNCGTINGKRATVCSNIECDAEFLCSNCGMTCVSAYYNELDNLAFCSNCGTDCPDCGRFYNQYSEQCSFCNPRFECYHCGSWGYGEPHIRQGLNTCEDCTTWFCDECETYCRGNQRIILITNDDGNRICNNCNMVNGENSEEFDDEAEMNATNLALPTIPGRESIRLCGVEIEGGHVKTAATRAGDYLARQLYDAGLSGLHTMSPYHHGAGFARVETDASVDWEMVIGPINMARTEDVRKLNKAVKIVRAAIKENKASLDLRAGTHIHVSAERVALQNAYNLHTIYLYLEDLLYRIGAAKWPIHRSLLRIGDDHYKTNPKVDTVTQFARTFHEDRYYGLSFNNYFERMYGNCRCGAARYGVFEECTCSLNKCTFEFRLFNSTANTVKLHAYLALCQSLVAKAISMEREKDRDAFPELPFVQKKFTEMDDTARENLIKAWEPRLEYMATQLPLTKQEKESIHYCIINSDMKVLEDKSKELFLNEGGQ